MQLLMDQLRLRNDLVIGAAAHQASMLLQFASLLDAEVRWQNHLISLSAQGSQMREVHDLATGMKEALAGLKKTAVDARSKLLSEVQRAQVNAGKVHSVATELSDANKEVEDFLGETGSNFPPSSSVSVIPQPHTDVNGVTLNTKAGS